MLANRVLSLYMTYTKAYTELLAKSRAVGLAIESANAFIAAVALANGFTVATRDNSSFENCQAKHRQPLEDTIELIGIRPQRSFGFATAARQSMQSEVIGCHGLQPRSDNFLFFRVSLIGWGQTRYEVRC
jgi:hypothetical protein